MHLHLHSPKDSTFVIACVLVGLIAVKTIISRLSKRHKLSKFPTVGSNGWLGSWWTSQKDIQKVIQEGYEKYKGLPFKITDNVRWIVVLCSRKHIEEIRNAPEDELSFVHAINDAIQLEYTMAPELLHDLYHFDAVRSRLTRNLGSLYSNIRGEISDAFDDVLGIAHNDPEWKAMSVSKTIQCVAFRATNRAFVGLPLCRDADWMNVSLQYPMDVIKAGSTIRRFPGFLAPIVAYFMTDVIDSKQHAIRCLTPVIEERLKLLEEYGDDRDDRPNDLLSWFMDEAPEGTERTVKLWTVRLLSIVFMVSPISNIFSLALLLLAGNPQYVHPLREEVETVVEKQGWSKGSLSEMHKIDSFLKESQRLCLLTSLSMTRMALKDFTFSDGTFIPKGTLVAVASLSRQLDDAHYENAHAFNPFRFSDLRSQETEGAKHDFVSTSVDFLLFGHGKHACPARFLTALILKSILAHVVVSYDVKLEDGAARSEALPRGYVDPAVRVMFRRRIL